MNLFEAMRSSTPQSRAKAAREAAHERAILEVMCVLPVSTYSYEQVEAAINNTGVSPQDIYENLAANHHTFALERFYEALDRPK